MMWQKITDMDLVDFRDALKSNLDLTLPESSPSRLSSVMIIIYDDPPKILMTKKALHLKIHAGEIAFPGGKLEAGDPDLLYTALRETWEELGLTLSESDIVGQLESVTTLNSNFVIFPFVCILTSLPEIHCNREVDKVLNIPAASFLKTLQCDHDPDHNRIQEMYTFTFEGNIVWGASARMLKQIFDRLSVRNLI